MGELTTRGYRDSDAPALADLLNRMELHVGGHPYMTTDEAGASLSTYARVVMSPIPRHPREGGKPFTSPLTSAGSEGTRYSSTRAVTGPGQVATATSIGRCP